MKIRVDMLVTEKPVSLTCSVVAMRTPAGYARQIVDDRNLPDGSQFAFRLFGDDVVHAYGVQGKEPVYRETLPREVYDALMIPAKARAKA